MSFLLETMNKHYNGTTIKTTKNAINITLHLYKDFINPIRILNKLEKLFSESYAGFQPVSAQS